MQTFTGRLVVLLMCSAIFVAAQTPAAPATPKKPLPKKAAPQGTQTAKPAGPATTQTGETPSPGAPPDRPQAGAAEQSKATPGQYCNPDVGFCFDYPKDWEMMGEVFEGDGVVVAPIQEGERTYWNQVTVAALPSAEDDPEASDIPADLDETLQRMLDTMKQGTKTFETQQRKSETVDELPAQFMKVHYLEEGQKGREWIEELTFVQGPDNVIYSIALKSSPEMVAQLEPAYRAIVKSFQVNP
jgi:hypothetical protein